MNGPNPQTIVNLYAHLLEARGFRMMGWGQGTRIWYRRQQESKDCTLVRIWPDGHWIVCGKRVDFAGHDSKRLQEVLDE